MANSFLGNNGVLTVSDAHTISGTVVDIEAYKAKFNNVIKNYPNRVGGWDITLEDTYPTPDTIHLRAVISFENLIDACYFVQLWGDEIPAFCSVFLPTANQDNLYF